MSSVGASPKGPETVEQKATARVRRHVTVQDVAHKVGVSKTTAASILRNAPDFQVSEATRRRVMAAAETLGYQRHAVAAALSSGRTNTVGLLLPLPGIDARLPASRIYGQDIFVAVFQAASRVGLRVTAIPLPQGPDAKLSLRDVTDRSVDGVVIASLRDQEFTEQIYRAGFPCVEIGSGYGRHLIHPDNEGGAEAAIEHLVSLGHKRIVHWRGAGDNYASHHRATGFLSAAQRFNLCKESSLVLTEKDKVIEVLSRPASKRPTAIFAYNDYQACLAIDIARDLHLRVPEDLSVVGFDDNILAEGARPQLTTIRNPLGTQADAAINLLQALWSGDGEKNSPRTIPTRLVVRHSTTVAPNTAPVARPSV